MAQSNFVNQKSLNFDAEIVCSLFFHILHSIVIVWSFDNQVYFLKKCNKTKANNFLFTICCLIVKLALLFVHGHFNRQNIYFYLFILIFKMFAPKTFKVSKGAFINDVMQIGQGG